MNALYVLNVRGNEYMNINLHITKLSNIISLYKTVHYTTVLDIRQFKGGPQKRLYPNKYV